MQRHTAEYKAVFVDFDGVLRRWPASDHLIEKKYGLLKNSIGRTAFEKKLLIQAIRGTITDKKWRSEIADKLQAEQPGSEAKSAIDEWSSTPGEIDAEMFSLLSRLKPTTEILLLTNATSRLREDIAALGLNNWFSHVVNSSEVGSIKPDQEIFRVAIEACQCTIDEIVFFDDSADNTLAATKVGILSHHYIGASECKRFLQGIGLLHE